MVGAIVTDRWNPTVVERVVEHPRNTVFAPGDGPAAIPSGDLSSQHRVTQHPAGFVVRERGAISDDALVTHAYRCPVHGVFDARVSRQGVPDEVFCPATEPWADRPGTTAPPKVRWQRCGLTSPWAGSFAGQGFASGECRS